MPLGQNGSSEKLNKQNSNSQLTQPVISGLLTLGAVFLVSAIKRHQGIRLIGRVAPARIPAIPQLTPAAERNQLHEIQETVN
jgi:hypothetical protein